MSPENQWLEGVFPIKIVLFLRDMLVFGGVCSGAGDCLFKLWVSVLWDQEIVLDTPARHLIVKPICLRNQQNWER